MKTIIWQGEKRILPGLGEATPGEPISMSDEVADNYIKQGLAKEESKLKKSNKVQEVD